MSLGSGYSRAQTPFWKNRKGSGHETVLQSPADNHNMQPGKPLYGLSINPLTTDDAFWHHQILATCYQLVQSILKIGSALAERMGQGEVSGYTALPDSAWWRLQLPVEMCKIQGASAQTSIGHF